MTIYFNVDVLLPNGKIMFNVSVIAATIEQRIEERNFFYHVKETYGDITSTLTMDHPLAHWVKEPISGQQCFLSMETA